MRRTFWIVVLAIVVPAVHVEAEPAEGRLRVAEVVADPQQDWDGDGRVTASDEYVELENVGSGPVELEGWRLLVNDTTPATLALGGRLEAGARRVFLNPPGEVNNNAHVAVVSADGAVADEVRFGSWTGAAGVPSADASGVWDESLSVADGAWTRRPATPGTQNTGPQVRPVSTWTPGPAGAWLSAGAAGWLNVTVRHAEPVLESVEVFFEVGANRTSAGSLVAVAPAREIVASFDARAPDGNFTSVLEVHAGAASWTRPLEAWSVDADPPGLPEFPLNVWGNATPIRWGPSPATDAGVGGVEWQWSNATGDVASWSADAALVSTQAQDSWRARVRDALGHTSPWGPVIEVRLDAGAPAAIEALSVEGEAPFRLRWERASDDGSSVARLELRREADVGADWRLGANATMFDDAFSPGRSPLRYLVRAVDAAGNVGPWATVEVDHAGMHPSVAGIRLRKPVWGSGVQEVRVDFDRPMDAGRPPRILVDGEPREDEGRMLANRSTFFLRWDDAAEWDEGEHSLVVAEAISDEGQRLLVTAHRTFVVDRTAPRLAVAPAYGWTNAAAVKLAAEDASPTRIEWRFWAEGEEPPPMNSTSGPGLSVPLPAWGNWSVEAIAIDAASNRGASSRGVFRVDRVAPAVGPALASGASWFVPAWDVESGVDWSSVPSAPGWRVTGGVASGGFRFDRVGATAAGRVSGSVEDLAGNEATFEFFAGPPPEPAPDAGDAVTTLGGGSDLGARMRELSMPVPEPREGLGVAWGWVAAVAAASVGAGSFVAWRRHRRPSFLRRILAARAAEARDTGA